MRATRRRRYEQPARFPYRNGRSDHPPGAMNLADLAMATEARGGAATAIRHSRGRGPCWWFAVAVSVALVRHGCARQRAKPGGTRHPRSERDPILTAPGLYPRPIALCKPRSPALNSARSPAGGGSPLRDAHNDPRAPWSAWDPAAHKYIRSAGDVRPPGRRPGLISDGRCRQEGSWTASTRAVG